MVSPSQGMVNMIMVNPTFGEVELAPFIVYKKDLTKSTKKTKINFFNFYLFENNAMTWVTVRDLVLMLLTRCCHVTCSCHGVDYETYEI